jgi:hypothetical protein
VLSLDLNKRTLEAATKDTTTAIYHLEEIEWLLDTPSAGARSRRVASRPQCGTPSGAHGTLETHVALARSENDNTGLVTALLIRCLVPSAVIPRLGGTMPVDRPPRSHSPQVTPQIAIAILNWLRESGSGPARIQQLYLRQEAYANALDALIELEDRYGRTPGELIDEHRRRLLASAQNVRLPAPLRSIPRQSIEPDKLVQYLSADAQAEAFVLCLPEPELLTALEYIGYDLGPADVEHFGSDGPDLFGYMEQVFRRRGMPYTASPTDGIEWVGEPTINEEAIEPALAALTDPRLAPARDEFARARAHLRRGELRDAGKAAGDAVETSLAVLLGAHGGTQPQTDGGDDLVQAGLLFDALKAKELRLLDQDRDHALIFGPIKVRHTCAHGVGATPKSPDPAYVTAGVATAAVAITYLASKLPALG